MSIRPDNWAFARAHQRLLEAKECLAGRYGQDTCAGKIVRAHIIPRSQLQQIAIGGHVHAVPTQLTAVMRMQHSLFEAQDFGVGEFSVLNCFCARHDKKLFAPLEDEPLTFSEEQLALLHYRAIAAEAYQRGNQEDGASAELRKYSYDDPRRDAFYTIFHINSIAAEAAEDTLKRLERIFERKRYDRVRALIVRFRTAPMLLSVGAFRPLYDVTGQQLQNLETDSAYLAMHVLTTNKQSALVFTWLRGQKAAERFAKSFAAQPREQITTLAIQMAFEYAEHTCMRQDWWLGLNEEVRDALLWRVKRANSLNYIRSSKLISFRSSYDDWGVDSVQQA